MTRWIIDPERSFAEFNVRYMMFARVQGKFTGISGAVELDPGSVAGSSVYVRINTASVSTGDQTRDSFLRGPVFFDTDKHPEITFKSTDVEDAGEHCIRITGDLTIRGVSRRQTFEGEYYDQEQNGEGKARMHFVARTGINREDYGITLTESIGPMDFLVDRNVQIVLDITLVPSLIQQG